MIRRSLLIKYDLICARDHVFEAWFSIGSDFDEQAPKGLIECPHCGSNKIEKAIMAPNVSTSRKKDSISEKKKAATSMMNAAADKIRKEIADNCDYVGGEFANEARAIHYGEKPERAIYGEASAREAIELKEEGVGIAPLPDILAPKPKTKMN